MKAAPDVDLYMEWSLIVEAPTFIGDRAAALAYLTRSERAADAPEVRLQRADETGTSAKPDPLSSYDGPLEGAWDDSGLIVEQQGWLPRAKFADFMRSYVENGQAAAYELLEPLDDEELL